MEQFSPEWWARRNAREFRSIDSTCWTQLEILKPRLKLAEDRFDRLQAACNAFEAATESNPTPLDDARLDRLGAISGAASNVVDMLQERIALIEKISSLAEQESSVVDDNRRTRGKPMRQSHYQNSRGNTSWDV